MLLYALSPFFLKLKVNKYLDAHLYLAEYQWKNYFLAVTKLYILNRVQMNLAFRMSISSLGVLRIFLHE